MILLLILTIFPLYSAQSTRDTASNNRNGFLPANESFVFNLKCPRYSLVNCTAVKVDLETVGSLIANELYFKVPVSVCVNMDIRFFSLNKNGAPRYPSQVVKLTMGRMACK